MTITTVDPLEQALDDGPRCECEHPTRRCGRRATFRVSALCAAEDCDAAVHVHLLCAECKDAWLDQARHDPTTPELRVTPL